MTDNWASVRDAADHFGVSTNTIRAWIRGGRITATRIGPKLIRVDFDSVARLITPTTTH